MLLISHTKKYLFQVVYFTPVGGRTKYEIWRTSKIQVIGHGYVLDSLCFFQYLFAHICLAHIFEDILFLLKKINNLIVVHYLMFKCMYCPNVYCRQHIRYTDAEKI